MFLDKKKLSVFLAGAGILILGKGNVLSQSGGYLDPKPNTTGLWHLDEGQGRTAKDSSKNSLQARLRGSANWGPSEWGKSVFVDGSTGLMEIPDPAGKLGLTGKFTLELWVNIAETKGLSNPVISRAARNGKSAFELRFMSFPQGWAFKMQDGTGLPMVVYGRVNIKNNEWHHVAFSHDGKTGRLFCDGIEISRMKFSSWMQPDLRKPWTVGKGEGGSVFKGWVDELHFLSVPSLSNDLRTGMTIYGFGKPGTNYVIPTIRVSGGPPSTTSNTMKVIVEKGYPNLLGMLFISAQPGLVQIPGGWLMVSASPMVSLFFLMDGGLVGIPGTAKGVVPLPPPGPSLKGLYICTQALALDPGAYLGYSLTPGMVVWFPY